MTKLVPIKTAPRFERYNCTGKLRVEVKGPKGEVEEVILLPKGGGCETNLKAIGSLLTLFCECNIDMNVVVEALEKVRPCTAPKERQDYKEGKIAKEDLGFGGCPKIIAEAIRMKMEEK